MKPSSKELAVQLFIGNTVLKSRGILNLAIFDCYTYTSSTENHQNGEDLKIKTEHNRLGFLYETAKT